MASTINQYTIVRPDWSGRLQCASIGFDKWAVVVYGYSLLGLLNCYKVLVKLWKKREAGQDGCIIIGRAVDTH